MAHLRLTQPEIPELVVFFGKIKLTFFWWRVSQYVGLLQLLIALLPATRNTDSAVMPFQAAPEQVSSYRLAVHSECEITSDCVGGECRPDPAGSGKKICICLPQTFRLIVAPALEICLKCRDLDDLCSFDQECQCSDSNAICDIQTPSGKGRCRCRVHFIPVFDSRGNANGRSNVTCKTGGVRSICVSDHECTLIRFTDSHGRPIGKQDEPSQAGGIQAKCKTWPEFTATAAWSLEDVNPTDNTIGIEELDGFDQPSKSPGSEPMDNFFTSTAPSPVSLMVPQPRGTSPPANITATTVLRACQCPDGFTVDVNDSYVCRDMDECGLLEAGRDPCNPTNLENAQTSCVNTVGSYRCECNSTMALGQGLPPTGICCTEGHIPCLDSSRCISFNSLCNGFPDCELDCSDELYPFCNFNKAHPFPDLVRYPQCHETSSDDDVTMGLNKQSTSDMPVLSPRTTGSFADLLPLGAYPVPAHRQVETPPSPLPTLPSNMTAARLLGYVLV